MKACSIQISSVSNGVFSFHGTIEEEGNCLLVRYFDESAVLLKIYPNHLTMEKRDRLFLRFAKGMDCNGKIFLGDQSGNIRVKTTRYECKKSPLYCVVSLSYILEGQNETRMIITISWK